MSNFNILITGDFDLPEIYVSANVIQLRAPKNNDDIIKHLKRIEHYIVGGPEYIDDYIMSQAPKLRHIVVMGTATNSFIDIEAARSRNITVHNIPGINADVVAEFALGSIIVNLANSFYSRDALLKGEWYQKPHKSLSEVKLGIIGLGNIGIKLTSKIRSISPTSEIYYFSRTRKVNIEKEFNIQFRNLLDLAHECDIIILCIAYNEESHKIIDNTFMKVAKKGIILFNFSNPLTVDPIELSIALENGIVHFAFFDGYYDEWIKNKGHMFDSYGLLNFGADKFVATSHIAAQANLVILELINKAFELVNDCNYGYK